MGSTIRIQALIVALLGCADESASPSGGDATVSDCSTVADWQDRLDCAYGQAEPLVETDELEAKLSTLEATEDRDMVLYRLAVNHPQQASRLCQMVTTRAFVEKCQQVVGRPHLSTTPRPSQPRPSPSPRP